MTNNRIGAIRQQKGLTLEDVARAAQTTRAQVQKLESGRRRLTLAWMKRIALALGVKMSALLPEEEVEFHTVALEPELVELLQMLSPGERRVLLRSLKAILQIATSGRGDLSDVLAKADWQGDPA